MTAGEALNAAMACLRRGEVESPRREAELLLAHLLGVPRTSVIAHPERPLSAVERGAFEQLVRRREGREPLPYLLGRWEFMGLSLRVNPAVLIPRPETELLVEALAARVERGRVLDVGTGSGCIALALAHLRPGLAVVALDRSPAALAVAAENAAELGLAGRVTFVEGSFPAAAIPHAPFAGIAANPPYIPSAEIPRLQPEVRDHEPRLALDGGVDGLALLRPLAQASPTLLAEGGWLATEVALGQAPVVEQLLRAAGHWRELAVVPDLAGIARVVVARRGETGFLKEDPMGS
jgi:release factor glutamine methyltransferase